MIFKTTRDIPEKSRYKGRYSLLWFEVIDLDELYPITFVFVLQRAFPFLLGYLAILATLAVHFCGFLPEDYARSFDAITIPLLIFSTLGLGALLFFWELTRRAYDVRIEGMRLNFTKGLFKKKTGALVLRANNVVYLYQNPLDVLFGVFQIQVYGSNQPKTEYACLPALRAKDAFDLFRFLADELSNQVSVEGADPEED